MLFLDFIQRMAHFIIDLEKNFGCFRESTFSTYKESLFSDDLRVKLEFVNKMLFELIIEFFVFFLVIVKIEYDKFRFSIFVLFLNLRDPIFSRESLISFDFDINIDGFVEFDSVTF